MKHTVFWDDTVYFGVKSSTFQRYVFTPPIEKKMKAAAASSATSVELCETTKHHMPADSSLHHNTVA
jgi:hypothetical protein